MGLVQLGNFEPKSVFTEGKFTVAFAEYTAYADYRTGPKDGFFIHLVNVPDSAPDKVDHQWISAGSLDFTAPSKDGENFVNLESADYTDRCGPFAKTVAENSKGIPQNTNAEFWYGKLQDAGFDTARLNNDINKTLSGMVYYAITVEQPERDMKDRKGYVRKKNDDGTDKKPTIKVPDKILSYDGNTSAAPADAIDYTDSLVAFLTGVLSNGPQPVANLNTAMIKAATGNTLIEGDREANQKALPGMMTLHTPEWLDSSTQFTLDGNTVSMS